MIGVDGLVGRYSDFGDGPALVFLTASVTGASLYHAAAGRLARWFRVILVDLPGTGLAPGVRGVVQYEGYARWVAGLVEKLGLGRVVLVGHSTSGAIAAIVAARWPGVVGRLVLADPAGAAPIGPVTRVLWGYAREVHRELPFAMRAGPMVVGGMVKHWRNWWGQAWQALDGQIVSGVGRIGVPTLVAWGRHDRVTPVDHVEAWRAVAPGARVYWCGRGSHDWLVEHAGEFARVVREFVGGASGT